MFSLSTVCYCVSSESFPILRGRWRVKIYRNGGQIKKKSFSVTLKRRDQYRTLIRKNTVFIAEEWEADDEKTVDYYSGWWTAYTLITGISVWTFSIHTQRGREVFFLQKISLVSNILLFLSVSTHLKLANLRFCNRSISSPASFNSPFNTSSFLDNLHKIHLER